MKEEALFCAKKEKKIMSRKTKYITKINLNLAKKVHILMDQCSLKVHAKNLVKVILNKEIIAMGLPLITGIVFLISTINVENETRCFNYANN